MDTLLLDTVAWDLVLDVDGNPAVASDPYSITQDICSAVRLFLGELWYDTTKGVPYYERVLGYVAAPDYLRAVIEEAALSVPQVTSATCIITSFKDRLITGIVQYKYTVQATGNSTATTKTGIFTFIGDNDGVITFVGDNGAPLSWYGEN